MHNIKMVIVPAWLNLIKKELGITNDDLADWVKLSDILSPRDLLIYKVVNHSAREVLAKVQTVQDNGVADALLNSFQIDVPPLSLLEKIETNERNTDMLIYGPTARNQDGQPLYAEVSLSDSELLCVCLVPYNLASDALKQDKRTVAEKITQVMFERVGLTEAVGTGAFRQYVKEIPFNPVLY